MRQKTTILFIFSFFFLNFSALAEEPSLYNKGPVEDIRSRYTAKKMHTMSFDTPKPKKEEPVVPAETAEEQIIEASEEKIKTVDDIPKDEQTEGHKLYKKYKDLAEKREAENAAKVEEAKTEDKEESKEETAEAEEIVQENEEDIEPEDIQPANGIAGILEQYKKSKSEKKPISTRSFGSID